MNLNLRIFFKVWTILSVLGLIICVIGRFTIKDRTWYNMAGLGIIACITAAILFALFWFAMWKKGE